MRRRSLRIAVCTLAFMAMSAGAFGQSSSKSAPAEAGGVLLDTLPKHPIPYRAFKTKVAKPKPKTAQAASSAATEPGSSTKPASKTAPANPTATKPAAASAAAPISKPTTPKPAPSSPGPTAKPPPAPASSQGPTAKKSAPPPPPAPVLASVKKPVVMPVQTAPPKVSPPPAQQPVQAPPPPPLLAPQAGARLQPGQSLPPSELEAFVDGQVTRAMAGDHVAGVAVAVVQNGQLVMEKGYGAPTLSPAQKLDPRQSLVRLGSGSQIFTWIAALKAVEEGKLKLDSPINTALPDELKIPDEGFDKPILFRHLMSHTAGFEDRALGRRYVHEADKLRPLDTALKTLRPRRVRGAGLLSIPSDYGVALAGDIIARLEGRPFDQLIEGEVLHPLGLNHTSFREPYPAGNTLPDPLDAKLANAVASGFHWTGHGFERQAFSYGQSLAPAVAASTTADDMARLMIALLNNGKLGDVSLFSAKTAALLRTPLQRPAPGMDGWAHGLAMQTFPGGFHALSDIGAAPAFASNLTLVPGLNVGVFIVANTDTGAALTRSLPGAIVQRFYGSPSPPPSSAAEPDTDYAGSYLSAQRAYHGLEAFADRLTKQSTLAAAADGGVVASDRREAQIFAPTGAPDQFRSLDGIGLFTPTAHGKTQAYVIGSGGGAAERVGGMHSVSVLRFWAGATVLTILASVAGLFIRDRVDPRETRAQITANVTQIITCVSWSLAVVAFAFFAKEGLSPAKMMFEWPNRWLIVASSSALAAGLLSLLMVTQLPGAWREERRIHGWSVWRKLRHTTTVGVFLVFTAVLAAWGALEPWSS